MGTTLKVSFVKGSIKFMSVDLVFIKKTIKPHIFISNEPQHNQ